LIKLIKIFSIPPAIAAQKELLYGYLETAAFAFENYTKLVKSGIKERDAIF